MAKFSYFIQIFLVDMKELKDYLKMIGVKKRDKAFIEELIQTKSYNREYGLSIVDYLNCKKIIERWKIIETY